MSHSSHLDMADSTSSTDSMHSMMVPYLHFTGGDFLFFDTWQPTSPGAIFGACIGLLVLALFERWLASARIIFATYCRTRASVITAARDQVVMNRLAVQDGATDKNYLVKPDVHEMYRRGSSSSPNPDMHGNQRTSAALSSRTRTVAPFIPAHDVPRGILYALQMLVMYILMLAVMTFQAAYIIAIVIGLGLGEVFFGRVAGFEGH